VSSQTPGPQQEPRSLHYFIGIGIGFIPLILALLGFSQISFNSSLTIAGVVLYVAVFIATIVCLAIERVRFIGYGLLTMVFVAPVVFFIACTVILTRTA
jgi:hypothetical protein